MILLFESIANRRRVRRGLLIGLATSHLKVKCDVATKTVNGDLGRFHIEVV